MPNAKDLRRPGCVDGVPVAALLLGEARPFGPNGEPSAIDKHAIDGPLHLLTTGLAGDVQADRRFHGGPDKALHHYPREHYATWRQELPAVPVALLDAGGFGENLSTTGLTEADVCVGDVFALGGVRLQISQARQPCWKLNVRFGVPDMALRVQACGRTGWYYRVLETGSVMVGGRLRLLDRPHPEWPLQRLLHYLFIEPLDADALQAIAALHVLPEGWRRLATGRLTSAQVEDWSRRLLTPGESRQA